MSANTHHLINKPIIFFKSGLIWFGFIVAVIACVSILANNSYFFGSGVLTINAIFLVVGLLLAVLPKISDRRGIAGVLFLLPLSLGIGHELNILLNISILVNPNTGLDLVAGFFFGHIAKSLVKRQFSLQCLTLPWPIGLLLLLISLSSTLAIIRNIRQSATETSIFGFLFNLIHFRPIGWHDDYMPIADWIAYATAGALIISLLSVLRGTKNPNQLIFLPLVMGIFTSFLMGFIQSVTGFGLPASLYDFRRDSLGFAAIGFQPDIHAFAGHMLLGAVGLWGYIQVCKGKFERFILYAIVAFSWVGLLISKSRSSILIAIGASLIILLVYIWHEHRKWFYTTCGLTLTIIAFVLILLWNNELFSTLPFFSLFIEPIQLLKNKEFTSLSALGGISGSRFEIWSAAFNMIKAFPLMGVGQGNFYHLSADIAFSKSHFLALNNGENTHNYFLQTFAELGVVGIILFLFVFIFPLVIVKNQISLLPAGIGVIGLFLGNIYSHSFLVRENLLICSALLGLMYYVAYRHQALNSFCYLSIEKCLAYRFISIIAVLMLVFASMHEVYRSFYTKIFEIGVNCFQPRPLTPDGWSSGIYQITLSEFSKSFDIIVWRPSPILSKEKFWLRFDVLNGDGSLQRPLIKQLTAGQNTLISYEIQQILDKIPSEKNVAMRVSNCFTPRNLGLSTDGRILGVLVQELKIFNAR
jgi:O-antigen ligase